MIVLVALYTVLVSLLSGALFITDFFMGVDDFRKRASCKTRKNRSMFLKRGLKRIGSNLFGIALVFFVMINGAEVLEGSLTVQVLWVGSMVYLSAQAMKVIRLLFGFDSVSNAFYEFYKDLTYTEDVFEPNEEDEIMVSKIGGIDQFSATRSGTNVVGVGPTEEEAIRDFKMALAVGEEQERSKESKPRGRGWVYNVREETINRVY